MTKSDMKTLGNMHSIHNSTTVVQGMYFLSNTKLYYTPNIISVSHNQRRPRFVPRFVINRFGTCYLRYRFREFRREPLLPTAADVLILIR